MHGNDAGKRSWRFPSALGRWECQFDGFLNQLSRFVGTLTQKRRRGHSPSFSTSCDVISNDAATSFSSSELKPLAISSPPGAISRRRFAASC